jgi:hypothetical protein
MRLAAFADLLYDPDDGRCGGWSREELEAMNARFTERLEEAFRNGSESRESAANQVKLPTSPTPRFVAPLCPAARDALLRSAENALAFVVRG